ncbi:MAG: alanyl-tRNA editing protein [Eubacteriales bacterium]|nr:alanyl-tRNA editing protein [Eubacteriales bacterium]
MTRKLYQEDVYKKECESTVVEVQGAGTADDPYVLVLGETVFFPTGGGQPCDLGTIDGIPLTGVFEKDGMICHQLLPQGNPDLIPAPNWKDGSRVACVLDWNRRFEHMQRHCGEHILSGIFFRECGGVNRGFHMGSGYMTIDIDVPGITREDALRIETMTNEVIWANVPVTTRHYAHRSEAEKLPLRKALAIDEDITIVSVGDVDNPADCVACCGTHPSTSGQVGLLKILKLESYKGMTRVYFKAGKDALEDYQNKHRILAELNLKYSSDDNDLSEKMKVQEEKNKEIRQELYLMKNTLIGKAASEILNKYEAAEEQTDNTSVTTPGLLIREYPYFRANDLLSITKILTEKLTGSKPLIVLVSTRETLVILASSGKHDCGKIVKDNAHVWRGKGGGNAAGARVMFPSRDDLDCFIIFIKQAYHTTR